MGAAVSPRARIQEGAATPATGVPEVNTSPCPATTLRAKTARTHDISAVITEPCECGRTIRRFQRIGRRSDDMFIIRGINVFPSQVEAALLSIEGTLPHYQIVLTREKGLDKMEVQVEVTAEVFSDKIGALEALQARLSHSIDSTLGIHVAVSLVEPHTIKRSEGKAKRVYDNRNIQ